jgi:hypothetical protein
VPAHRWLARAAVASISVSVTMMIGVGAQRPSAAEVAFPAASGWPPWSADSHPSVILVSLSLWAAALLGGTGVALGLLAARRGWRPQVRLMVISSAAAVAAFAVIAPMGSGDMLDYAAYGRIAALGHSPYLMTPFRLKASGDPIGAITPVIFEHDPSVYGPLATASEWAASKLAGDSAARTVFWLKLWNALAYLAVALALDRLLRGDRAQRVRAHLLWSVNPLMLFAVLAGGHIDGLAACLGVFALAALRRADTRYGLLAGAFLGAAAAVKAPVILFGAGLAWAARHSPRALAALGLGTAAVLVPSYLLAGPGALTAVAGRATGQPVFYVPWELLSRALHWAAADQRIDAAGAIAFAALAAILLWRMPAGPQRLPAARPALALTLAWLIVSPQQRPWYDAMLFPLLAMMPATRLDWVVLFRAAAATMAELPGATFYTFLRPSWLSRTGGILSMQLVPWALILTVAALLLLCVTGRWTPADSRDGPVARPRIAARLRSS